MRPARSACLIAVLLGSIVGAGGARADGLPVLGIDVGNVGVTTPSEVARLVTIPAASGTIVARIAKRDGRVVRSRLLRGTFTIPAVAYDGSPGGLAADARTLVLIEPRVAFPRQETTLLALDARRLAPLRLVRLHGDFSFDAVSPQGRWMYLIQYTSPNDPTRYRVRVYDLRHGRLLTRPVLDPSAPDEKMRGAPLSRVASADGRWAYTLYDGAGGTPFIHALDTTGRTARCIDLAPLVGRKDLWQLRLRLDRGSVSVRGSRGALLTVDPRSFTVASASRGVSIPWRTAAAALLALILALAATIVVRRRHGRDATLLLARSTLGGDG
jgi:hypothetical protein